LSVLANAKVLLFSEAKGDRRVHTALGALILVPHIFLKVGNVDDFTGLELA
jgi:hypothetical protein